MAIGNKRTTWPTQSRLQLQVQQGFAIDLHTRTSKSPTQTSLIYITLSNYRSNFVHEFKLNPYFQTDFNLSTSDKWNKKISMGNRRAINTWKETSAINYIAISPPF